MKYLAGGLLLTMSFLVCGQNLDSLQIDSIQVDSLQQQDTVELLPKPHWALLANYGFSHQPIVNDYMSNRMYGVEVEYKNWAIGFRYFEQESQYNALVIFPNVFALEKTYAEFSSRYFPYGSEWIKTWLNVSYGQGELGWLKPPDNQLFLADRFSLGKLGFMIELDRFRWVRPYFSVEYQKAFGVELSGLFDTDLTGMVFGYGIRLGYTN